MFEERVNQAAEAGLINGCFSSLWFTFQETDRLFLLLFICFVRNLIFWFNSREYGHSIEGVSGAS